MHFEINYRAVGEVPNLNVFRKHFLLTKSGDWYTFERRRGIAESCLIIARTGLEEWKNKFFYIDDRYIPSTMTWKPTDSPPLKDPSPKEHLIDASLLAKVTELAHPIRKYQELVLVVSWISRKLPHPKKWPSISKNDEGKCKFFF